MFLDTTTPPVTAMPVKTGAREEADDYRGFVAQLSDDWRVVECRGGIQWILQRKAGQRQGAPRWQSVAFHRSRDTLRTAVQRRCGQVDPDQAEIIDALPAWIEEAT